jgi:hypothetical protein
MTTTRASSVPRNMFQDSASHSSEEKAPRGCVVDSTQSIASID